jgi:vancomycin permeability regulator SanA
MRLFRKIFPARLFKKRSFRLAAALLPLLRLAACADVNLLGTQPRFLGPPVPIGPATPQPPPVL